MEVPNSREDRNRYDLLADLRKHGWTLRQLSLQNGFSKNVIGLALDRPSPHAEAIIAEALGLHPWDIWPSRYDADHNPIPIGRRKSVPKKDRPKRKNP